MISVIIPTFNKSTRLKYCLKHLFACNNQYDIEIILINDGSNDETQNIINSMKKICPNNITFKSFNTLNKGRAVARNFGVEKSTKEILLFLDDDIIINEKVISMHIESHQMYINRIVHGAIYNIPILKAFSDLEKVPQCNSYLFAKYSKIAFEFSDSTEYEISKLEKHSKKSKFEKLIQNEILNNRKCKWAGFVGANTSIRKELFLAAGGFDTNFGKYWGCEDLEFGYRLNNLYKCNFIYNTFTKSYHLDHYEFNRKLEHDFNMNYFMSKYCDQDIYEFSKFINNII